MIYCFFPSVIYRHNISPILFYYNSFIYLNNPFFICFLHFFDYTVFGNLTVQSHIPSFSTSTLPILNNTIFQFVLGRISVLNILTSSSRKQHHWVSEQMPLNGMYIRWISECILCLSFCLKSNLLGLVTIN